MGHEFKYWAFISYNSKDKAWSHWLHRHLDGYRPPKRLVGRPNRDGKIPAQTLPVFRDREDLAGASSLADSLEANLRASQYLIVVCSPNSAGSPYVNDEVKYFKSLGREDRVFCFIVGGSPSASDNTCCYPPAVRQKYGADGIPSAEKAHPLAPDARPQGDGRRKACTKLIAGLLGVDNDELARREWWRTFWRRTRIASATTAAVAAIGAVALFAWNQHVAHLVENGRTDLLAGRAESALESLSAAYSAGDHSPAVLLMLRQARLSLPAAVPYKAGNELFCATFSPDDTRVVVAGHSGNTLIYDARTGKAGRPLRNSSGRCVNSAVFNQDGTLVLTASDDGLARLWDPNRPDAPIASFQHTKTTSKVYPAVFSPDYSLIATTGEDGTAKIWDAKARGTVSTPLRQFTGHQLPQSPSGIDTLVFNRQGTLVVTAGKGDKTARIWSPLTGEEIAHLSVPGKDGLRYAGFSPDGQRVVTCSWTGDATLWRVTGEKINQLIAPSAITTAWTRRACFSDDGKKLVTASADGIARVFDGETGTLLYTLDHASKALNTELKKIRNAAIRADGQLIATSGGDWLVKLWRPNASSDPAVLEAHSNWVNQVEFSHDGTRLSSAGQDGYAFIWDVTDPRSPKKITRLPTEPPFLAGLAGGARTTSVPLLEGHAAFIALTHFSPDGMYALTVDTAGIACVWSATTGKKITTLPAEQKPDAPFVVTDAVFNHDGRRLVAGAENGHVIVWDVPTRARLFDEDVLGGFRVHKVHFCADPNIVIVAGETGVKLLDLQTKTAVSKFDQRLLAVSRDGQLLAVKNANESQGPRICRIDGTEVCVLPASDGSLNCLNFSPSGRFVAVTANGDLSAWDLQQKGRSLFPRRKAHDGDAWFAGFSPDDSCIVTLGTDNQAQLWRVSDGKPLGALIVSPHETPNFADVPDRKGFLPTATFSADSRFVCTTSFESRVRVWDVATRLEVARLTEFPQEVATAAFSAQGALLLAGARDGSARIWNLGYETDSAETIAKLANGRLLVTGDSSGTPSR
jgi:WD40 repeat protein